MLKASAAVALLWLAVTFQPLSTSAIRGRDDSSSETFHDVFRLLVAARTRATSAAEIIDAWLPKAFRMYDPTAAIQSSGFMPIGIMTSVYVTPLIGPVSPCRSV